MDATIRAYDHADRDRRTHELCARLLTPRYREAISGTVASARRCCTAPVARTACRAGAIWRCTGAPPART